ncbi:MULTISPECIES: hypothetical protein [Burkholderia cepacia complex]|uniref:hypothetical protein n=1 Tax=Burkholderia seminalis TaxID=488731 RepID=UPI00016AF62A|nr:hypothetical protein [Burkholderia seminalis]MBJ9591059.1 hypothetical protein [Burkholderia seminalis]
MCATTSTDKTHRFASEADLVRTFLKTIENGQSPWGTVLSTTEWDYKSGFTDVLVRTENGDLVAFEAKLSDWRRATHQAYRNTMYARHAYVVMPERAAQRALAHPEIFSTYKIGLCVVGIDGIKVLIEPRDCDPLLPYLHQKAQNHFDQIANEQHGRSRRRRQEAVLHN